MQLFITQGTEPESLTKAGGGLSLPWLPNCTSWGQEGDEHPHDVMRRIMKATLGPHWGEQ